jgi:hypothetical protein
MSGAVFTGAQLGDVASFLGAHFFAPSATAEAATFQGLSAARDLDFTFSKFLSLGKPNPDRSDYVAFFGDLVCGGSLIFESTRFAPGPLNMQRLQAHDLVLDVGVTSAIPDHGQRRRVLRLIEASAKARGDLVTANDAHYTLRVDESRDYAFVPRALDYVFYRSIAGYFVRPFRPLVILFGVVALLSLLKTISDGRVARAASKGKAAIGRARRVWLNGRRDCGTFLTCFLDKLGLIRPQRADSKTAPPLQLRLEAFTYRLLVVCAVLGLANSNPTLRQMVETLL